MAAAERNWADPQGRHWRVLEGDFSHLPLHDRPPRVICENIAVGARIHFDRSPDRLPIPEPFPGKDIRELQGRHSGKVALLFNGDTGGWYNLRRISCPIIGMNRTYVGYPGYGGPDPDYLAIVDTCWLTKPEVREHKGLINGTSDPRPLGWRVPKSFRMAPFSFDLWRDGALPTTTGLLALQVAVWMGFTEIYCLGLDLGGPHFDGTKSGGNMDSQEKYCQLAAPLLAERGIKVYNCGSPDSRSKAFPKVPFGALIWDWWPK